MATEVCDQCRLCPYRYKHNGGQKREIEDDRDLSLNAMFGHLKPEDLRMEIEIWKKGCCFDDGD